MRTRLLGLIAFCTVATAANAIIIEDFEHGNAALYTAVTTGTNNFSVVAAAAHDGAFGGRFTGGGTPWLLRAAVATGPNNIYNAYIRFNPAAGGSTNSGRIYIGVGANSPGGTYSMVGATNTPTTGAIIQNNTPTFGFVNVGAVAFTYTISTWYQLRLTWGATGDMQLSVYDEPGTSLLASTGTFSTGYTTAGGLALRGFAGTGQSIDVDTISSTVVPEPATIAALGFGALAMMRRRKK